MPRSSGGSSSSFRGSSYRSYSSTGSSYHAHSSTTSTPPKPKPIRKNTPFQGHRHRYVYYRNYTPYYVYSDVDIKKEAKDAKKTYLICLLVGSILFGLLFFAVGGIKHKPYLKNTEQYGAFIMDDAGLIQDEGALEDVLYSFKAESGVTPVILTGYHNYWVDEYNGDIEDFVYDLYINVFDDETHWLIFYSIDDGSTPEFREDWAFMGMIGDDTDEVISDSMMEKFDRVLDGELKSGKSFETSITSAFEYLMPIVSNERLNPAGIVFLVIDIVWFVIFYLLYIGKRNKDGYKDSELFEIKDDELTEKCPDCGFEYFKGNFKRCPKCSREIE